MKSTPRVIVALLVLLIVGYSAFFTTQLILHYYSFGSRSLDLGNMNQAIWNTAHGNLFRQTNQPGATSRLSLHVEPILIPISWLYFIHSGPEILFLLQSVVVALGAVPVFALARHKLDNAGLALIFGLVYLAFPALQGATLLDFHAVTLAPTFLLAAFYCLVTGRPRWFGLFAILAAACKEDMGLVVMMMGLYALLARRQYRLGLLTMLLAGGWAVVAVFVIPPLFAGTENIHWNRYDHLGDSPLGIVGNLFARPGLFVAQLRAVGAGEYIRLLLTPTAFTALFSPLALLLALPSLGINLLSSFPPMQRVNSLIYAAPIIPAVMIGSIYGVANLKRLWGRVYRGEQAGSWFNLAVGGLLLAGSLAYHLQYGYLPGGGQFRGWEQVTAHHRRLEQVAAQIPPGAALSAHDRLNPHLSGRETVYIFDRVEEAEYIVLDVTEDSWPLHPVELRHRVDELLAGEFGIVEALDGYLLLARADLPTALPDPFFDFARVPAPAAFQPQFATPVTFGEELRLLGYDITTGAHEKRLPVTRLYWQALRPLEGDYTLWPFFIDRQGRVIEDPGQRPLVATLWYPTSRWQPGEIIVTSTLPWALGREFTLAVGVTRPGGSWTNPADRLPITAAGEGLYLFEGDTWARLGTFERRGRGDYGPLSPASGGPARADQAQFWHIIRLQGFDLPKTVLNPGEALPFTLYWQSTAPINVSLTTFAHLLDEQGRVIAQLDWLPQDSLGYLPTTAWQPGRRVVDSQAMPLSADLPPGQYRLVVGWYYPPTGERLPLTAGGQGTIAPLGLVTVK